jgi:hypothetical protein
MVGFLAFVGVAASATHYLNELYNPGFLEYPTIVALHVVLGGVYLLFAPFQFVKRIRSRHRGFHRRMGRVLVAIGLVVGATALFIGLVIPFSGWAESVLIALFGSLFLFALVKGFVPVPGRVALHREWMIRAFAIALAIATQRLIFIPSLFVAGEPTDGRIVTLSLAAWSAALVVHSSLAEVWIRLTRKRRVLGRSGAGQRMMPTAKEGRCSYACGTRRSTRHAFEEYRRFEQEQCMPMLHKQPGLLGGALPAASRRLGGFNHHLGGCGNG